MAGLITTCGIFLYNRPAGKFLVCHATNSRWTQWSIPKGLQEPGEDYFEAASRELREETAIELTSLDDVRIFPLPPSRYQKQNKILQAFLVLTDRSFEGHVFKSELVANKNFPEIDAWKWITPEQGKKWTHESQARLTDDIVRLAG
jgi:8-oxo-dGTP pyrophosphatase MutT (NUDIX family)